MFVTVRLLLIVLIVGGRSGARWRLVHSRSLPRPEQGPFQLLLLTLHACVAVSSDEFDAVSWLSPQAFIKWVESTQGKDKKLVVVEIGAGFNTPVVTRFPCESVARWHNNGSLVRINLDRSDVSTVLRSCVAVVVLLLATLCVLRPAGNSILFPFVPGASRSGSRGWSAL